VFPGCLAFEPLACVVQAIAESPIQLGHRRHQRWVPSA